jgi:drug/metabolite transporter (DMT)-like permease
MGVLLLGEPFTGWVVAGTVLVVAGVFVVSRVTRMPDTVQMDK